MVKAPPCAYEIQKCFICAEDDGWYNDQRFGVICSKCKMLLQEMGEYKYDDDTKSSALYYDFSNVRPACSQYFFHLMSTTHNAKVISTFSAVLLDYYGVETDEDAMIPVRTIIRRRSVKRAL